MLCPKNLGFLGHSKRDKMQQETILYEKNTEDKIATITLNRPEKLNALTLAMWGRINQIVAEADTDEDVKVVVFKGVGRAFCSGHDVGELGVMHGNIPGERRPSQRQRLLVDGSAWGRRGVCQTILNCKKSTLTLVQGYCYGGGLQIALETDVTIAAEDALFTHPGWRYIGPTTDVWLLIQTIGIKRAKEMMLTGTPIDAHKALEYGLVNKVVPLDKLEEEGEKMAKAMALLPFDGIVMGKVQIEAALDAMGMGSGYTAAYIMHAMQTGIRYEAGEFNLLKERKDKGMKGAIVGRERYYKEGAP